MPKSSARPRFLTGSCHFRNCNCGIFSCVLLPVLALIRTFLGRSFAAGAAFKISGVKNANAVRKAVNGANFREFFILYPWIFANRLHDFPRIFMQFSCHFWRDFCEFFAFFCVAFCLILRDLRGFLRLIFCVFAWLFVPDFVRFCVALPLKILCFRAILQGLCKMKNFAKCEKSL